MDHTPTTLNFRRLLCPMPVIKLQEACKTLPSGKQLKIICSDPGTQHDIPTWCRLNAHKVLSITSIDDEIHFLIEVA